MRATFATIPVFNIFRVVTFPNDPCNGTAGDPGVCYTSQECENLGGLGNGDCAAGFGVCCQCEEDGFKESKDLSMSRRLFFL